jgi:hypothetical protein
MGSLRWFALTDPEMMHDVEVLVLTMFPRYLHTLTQNDGNFLTRKP